MRSDFYVYVLFRPTGIPCYVGKGRGARIEHYDWAQKDNQYLCRIIRNAGGISYLPKVKVWEGLAQAEAHNREILLISLIGRQIHGGPLTNLTDGGTGGVTCEWTPELRQKLKVARKNRVFTAETRAKISAGRKRFLAIPENRAKMAYGLGRKYHLGKKYSPEHCANISKALKGKRTHLGMKRSVESRARIRAAALKREAARRQARAAIS